MALDFNILKTLSKKSTSKWGSNDFNLLGIPEENQTKQAAADLVRNLKRVVGGIEGANLKNVNESILSDAQNNLNQYFPSLINEINKYGGNVSVIPSQLVQNTLSVINQRRANQPYTPTVTPEITVQERQAANIPRPLLVPQGLSPLSQPIPAEQAPALTREYYLNQGIPESMLPPVAPATTQNIPSWVTGPAGGAQTQGLQTLTNPVTGETWTAPTGGYSVNVPSPTQATQPFLGGNMVNPLNPANLPALRGAASGTSSIDPTLRPYLELGLRGAEQLFLQQQPSLYPGQMYVGPSEQTQAALNMQEDIALAQPTSLQAAQESYMRGLGGLAATAGGAFLGMNPFQQQAIQAATRPIAQQYEQQVLPGVSSLFSRAGRYGSEAMGTALGRATEASARAIGDVSSDIAYQGYEAERARQQQAMGAQLSGATLAPQIYGQQFLPSQQLAQVGAAREAIAAQPLQEAIQRYQFQQQVPYQQLQGFLSSVYGTPMASSQYQPPGKTNQLGQVLGGALIGSQLGGMFGGAGGFTGGQIGAGLGALGGLLF